MAFNHYLDFLTTKFGQVQLPFEPAGFDSVGFGLEQGSGRKGRDVMGSGSGDNNYRITYSYGKAFEILIHEFNTYGHQAKVKYKVDYGDGIVTIGSIDMLQFKNLVTECTFVVIEDSNLQSFRDRYETSVNLFNNVDLKNNQIEPCGTQKMLWKAKPVSKASRWEYTGNVINKNFIAYGQDFFFISPINSLIKSDLLDSYVPFEMTQQTSVTPSSSELMRIADEMTYINAKTKLKNIRISIKGVNLTVSTAGAPVRTLIYINYGLTYVVGEYKSIKLFDSNNNVSLIDQTFNANIDNVEATTKIWIQISIGSAQNPGNTPVSNSAITYSSKEMTIESISEAKNTVIDVVRYIDAIKYATKSASGLEVLAPRYDLFGDMYDNFITNAQLMRGLTERPFNITCKDIIEEQVQPEQNGDYQLQTDGKLFIGGYWRDFYRDYECGKFYQDAKEGYSKDINPRFAINQFKLSYKNYATQKEITTDNTLDTVHGKLEYLVDNDSVNNVREAEIGFIRDPFLIQDMVDKANEISDTAATNDDDKIVIIDAVQITKPVSYTETALLNHNATTGANLILRNDNSFSWLSLGVYAGGVFTINNGNNSGTYNIVTVTSQQLNLIKQSGSNPVDIAELNTTFKYFVNPNVLLTARTNEGFSEIDNISDGDKFPNLRFPLGRNMRNYEEELSTARMLNKKAITNTIYEYNPKATTQVVDKELIVEGAPYYPNNPVLTPYIYNMSLQMNFKEYWELQESIRTNRGYITTLDADGNIIKGYLQKGEWTPKGDDPDRFIGLFNCTLEEKYEQFMVRIVSVNDLVTINEEYIPSGFSFDNNFLGNFSIFDATGKSIYTNIPYDRIKVNSSDAATSSEELAKWLKVISL